MVYQAYVNIDFKENCEYQGSTNEQYIDIPSKKIRCELSVVNSDIHYGETCTIKFKAYIDNNIPIKIGKVILYFDDGINKIEINKGKDFFLNEDGEVFVTYKPHNSGTITFEYIDTTGFYICDENDINKSKEILLKPKDTDIVLLSDTDFISDLKDEIKLKAQVVYDEDKKVPYGAVTFLHYNIEKSVSEPNINVKERVIGNPVPVINGEATISYVPMQYYGDDNIMHIGVEDEAQTQQAYDESHAEVIRAVYNYKSSSYGKQWKYFGHSDCYKNIYIPHPTDILIKVYKKESNNKYTELMTRYDEYPWGCAQKDDELVIVANLYNQGHIIDLSNNDATIDIHIEGNTIRPKNTYSGIPNGTTDRTKYYVENAFSYDKYSVSYNDIVYTTIGNDSDDNPIKGFCCSLTGDNALQPGFFTINCTSERIHNENNDVSDYYEAVESSMIYYLQQDFYDLEYEINFTSEEYAANINTAVPDIKVNITGLSNDEQNVLHNKNYGTFKIPELNIKCAGHIKKENDILVMEPVDNIIIQKAGTYNIFAYIKSDTYSDGQTSFNLQCISTNTHIYVKGDIQKSLNINIDNQYYPGVITYTASIENIETIIPTTIDINGEEVDNFSFTPSNTQRIKTISDLPIGNGVVELKPKGYETINKNFEIEKATISQDGTLIKPPIISYPNNTVNVILYTNGSKFIDNFEANHFTVEVETAPNKTIPITPISIQKTTNNDALILKTEIGVYKAGEYKIMVNYNGDNHYIIGNNNTFNTFTTYEVEPIVHVSFSETIDLQLNNVPASQVVPIAFKLSDGDDIISFTCVTDTDGKVSCPIPNNLNGDIEDYNLLTYTISPTLDIPDTCIYANGAKNMLNMQLEKYGNEYYIAGVKEIINKQQQI